MSGTSTFGVFTTVGGSSSPVTLNNLKYGESVDVAEKRDESGKVTGMKAYSKRTTVQGDGTLNTATIPVSEISAGAVIVVASGTFLVKSTDVTENNTDFAKFSFNAEKADSAVIEVIA